MSQYIGFGFGSEEEIRLGLEAILTEDWYRSWVKDALAPHIDDVRQQIREQVAQSQVDAAAAASAAHAATQRAPSSSQSLSVFNTGSSGVTLNTSADPCSSSTFSGIPGTAAVAATLAQAGGSVTGAFGGANARLELNKQPDAGANESVRKRSSFWKRSSTFISGGLVRTGQKTAFDTPATGSQVQPGAAGEKSQLGQFRVLSGRIFNEGKHALGSGNSTGNSADREYPVLPLSAHSPRMVVDSASGMVCICKDGKLAPPDTDCAAIQRDYYDLVATDPLLSIYFLVKERREREARGVADQAEANPYAPAHPSGHPLSHEQQPQPQPQLHPHPVASVEAINLPPAVAAKPIARGANSSNETWVKLERAGVRPANDNRDDRRPARKESDASAVRGRDAQAAQDLAAVLAQESHADTTGGLGAAGSVGTAAHPSEARPGVDRRTGDGNSNSNSYASVDQTTAAIEALSQNPRSRGSVVPPGTHGSDALSPPGFQDAKKKRSSIFKRFSVIVKGGRSSGQKLQSTPEDSNSHIVQAEGNEMGYMEITVHKNDTKNEGGGSDKTADRGAGASSISSRSSNSPHSKQQPPPPQHTPDLHHRPSNADSVAAKSKNAPLKQKYAVLDSIEEDVTYARLGDSAEEFNSGNTAAGGASVGASATSSPDAADAADPAAGRQYLTKPLCLQQPHDASLLYSAAKVSKEADKETLAGAQLALSTTVPDASSAFAPSAVDDHNVDSIANSAAASESGAGTVHFASRADPSHSLDDLDGTSSMFTNTDIDESDAFVRQALSATSSPTPSEKAALLERARREIEGLDEHEGVGLLDQTPELSYRVAGQTRKSNFDANKRRARSSSNTVVRVLSEIVRDTANGNGRGGRHIPGFAALSQHRGAKSTALHGQNTNSLAPTTKTIMRHSSTGAINRTGGANEGFDSSPPVGTQYVLHPTESNGASAGNKTALPDPALAGTAGRPDILRSHSHTNSHQFRGLALPERIAEVPESPPPREQQPENALRIGTGSGARQGSAGAYASDSKCSELAGKGSSRELDQGGNSSRSGQQPENTATIGFKLDSESGSLPTDNAYASANASSNGEVMRDISSAPPRADDYLKPVFLKGLFSVATTSTRSPAAIRDNLLGVLAGMPLRFHEGRGYFTCSMATAAGPANLQESTLDAYAHGEPAASNNSGLHKHKKSLRLPGVDRKISFRRRPKHIDEAVLSLTTSSVKLAARDGLSSTDDVLLGSRQSVIDSTGEDAKDNQQQQLAAINASTNTNTNANAICFQIFLVRMPLLGLCGLQFRRVSGPAWKYKDICSDILKRLKL
ncbi:Serine/threonine-protein kinase [Kickxella alabastrina]|uniref:Serine/threonine-protein kinase n=1 Tax=Kickxella alabastrina TaxID=61397 RepID=A0ACC1I4E8_9FUNG|nr:Serine/threonine-protein kinase [Kickxella alabastrina]